VNGNTAETLGWPLRSRLLHIIRAPEQITFLRQQGSDPIS
jgi:hypothetical protein